MQEANLISQKMVEPPTRNAVSCASQTVPFFNGAPTTRNDIHQGEIIEQARLQSTYFSSARTALRLHFRKAENRYDIDLREINIHNPLMEKLIARGLPCAVQEGLLKIVRGELDEMEWRVPRLWSNLILCSLTIKKLVTCSAGCLA